MMAAESSLENGSQPRFTLQTILVRTLLPSSLNAGCYMLALLLQLPSSPKVESLWFLHFCVTSSQLMVSGGCPNRSNLGYLSMPLLQGRLAVLVQSVGDKLHLVSHQRAFELECWSAVAPQLLVPSAMIPCKLKV